MKNFTFGAVFIPEKSTIYLKQQFSSKFGKQWNKNESHFANKVSERGTFYEQ